MKLLSCAGLPNVNYNNYSQQEWENYITNLSNDFPGLYDYYIRYNLNVPAGQQVTDAQHEMMAQHYIDIIKDALQEFDPSQTDEVYEALAWVGLKGEGTIDETTGLPPNPTVAWANKSQEERIQLNSIFNNFINSNPPCQN